MNKIFSLLIFVALSMTNVSAQKSPVSWSFTTNELNDKNIEIVAIATMPDDWVIYSQFTEDGGPIPTSFDIAKQEVHFVEKSSILKVFDHLFDVNVMKFKHEAIFTYTTDKSLLGKVGHVTYMTCDGSRCLPPTSVEFMIK